MTTTRIFKGTESEVKGGSDGFVKVRGEFIGLREYDKDAQAAIGEKYYIEQLGWGDTFGGFVSDYQFTKEEMELLKSTL